MKHPRDSSLNPDGPPSKRGLSNSQTCGTTSNKKETNDTISDSTPKGNDITFVPTSEDSNKGTSRTRDYYPSQEQYKSQIRGFLKSFHGAKKAEKERYEKGYSSAYSASKFVTTEEEDEQQFEKDFPILQMKFTGLPCDSLLDTYLATLGDLEKTIDILHQLERDPVDYVGESASPPFRTPLDLNSNVEDATELQASHNASPSDSHVTQRENH